MVTSPGRCPVAASSAAASRATCARTAAATAAPSMIVAVMAAAPRLDQSKIGVTVSATCTNNQYAAGSDTEVTVTYPYSVSILGKVVASGNLSSSTTMREE